MKKEIITTLNAPAPIGPYNQAVKITDVQDLGDVMINQLTDLFVEKNKKTIH